MARIKAHTKAPKKSGRQPAALSAKPAPGSRLQGPLPPAKATASDKPQPIAATPKLSPAAPAPSPAPAAAPLAAPPPRQPKTAVPRPLKSPRPRKPVTLPKILLEGDVPPAPAVSGPGERYSLGAAAAPPPPPSPLAVPVRLPSELPEAYGTERIFLTARDPHWLYASWDLTAEQRRRYNSLSREGHLAVRTYINEVSGSPVSEVQVHPESKSWFIHVPRGGTRYAAELGYYEAGGSWRQVTVSTGTLTPPEAPSQESAIEFATIPPEVTLKQLFTVVQQAVSENVPLAEVVQQLRAEGWTQLPEIVPAPPPAWTPAQAQALAEVVRLDEARRVWMGSVEITEVIRRHLHQEISSAGLPGAPAQPAAPGEAPLGAISSPFGAEGAAPAAGQAFWLNVNAELVLYGATEPDARVTVAGRTIRLRPDGTFSFRFALPDGQYSLTVSARSADEEHGRASDLQFSRSTRHQGEVGAHPQDPGLKPPLPAHIG